MVFDVLLPSNWRLILVKKFSTNLGNIDKTRSCFQVRKGTWNEILNPKVSLLASANFLHEQTQQTDGCRYHHRQWEYWLKNASHLDVLYA